MPVDVSSDLHPLFVPQFADTSGMSDDSGYFGYLFAGYDFADIRNEEFTNVFFGAVSWQGTSFQKIEVIGPASHLRFGTAIVPKRASPSI